jgi:hypothetical protein
MSGKTDGATALAKTSGMDAPGADVPDIDTAAGAETAASNNNSTPPNTPQPNLQQVPPVNSRPNPFEATPI